MSDAIAWSKTLRRDPLDLRGAPEQFLERFWSKVDIGAEADCWPWMASCINGKYGQFYIRKRVPVPASRVALALQGHVLTVNIDACHTCDNPPCCNPAHLFAGSAHDNVVDCIQKGRGRRSHGEEHRDAKLTAEIVASLRRADISERGAIPRLARTYGCSESSIRKAIFGRSWKHVPMPVEAA